MSVNPTLKPYTLVADLIAATFGDDVEVVIHDLTDPLHSVVYVANNTVTCRKIGQNFRHLFADGLKAQKKTGDLLLNYTFSDGAKKIRSSSLLIRDKAGAIAGAMCINIDTTQVRAMHAWLEKLLPDTGRRQESPQSAESATGQTVEELIDAMVPEGKKLSRQKRLELMEFLQTRGIFAVRGALERVAGRLGIAKVTVYSDLAQIKKTKSDALLSDEK